MMRDEQKEMKRFWNSLRLPPKGIARTILIAARAGLIEGPWEINGIDNTFSQRCWKFALNFLPGERRAVIELLEHLASSAPRADEK
jgi:hypothetical protein